MDTQNVRKNFIPLQKYCDVVIFIERTRCYEIIICQRDFSKIPASSICKEVKDIVETTLDNIITDNNETETVMSNHRMKSLCSRYETAFDCPLHPNEGHLCVVPNEDKDHSIMQCEVSNEPVELKGKELVWFGEVSHSIISFATIVYVSILV